MKPYCFGVCFKLNQILYGARAPNATGDSFTKAAVRDLICTCLFVNSRHRLHTLIIIAGAPIVICQACKSRSCFTHDVPWHAGLTCDQYNAERARQMEDVQANIANEGYLRENTKACPNEACRRKVSRQHLVCYDVRSPR